MDGQSAAPIRCGSTLSETPLTGLRVLLIGNNSRVAYGPQDHIRRCGPKKNIEPPGNRCSHLLANNRLPCISQAHKQ